MDTARDDDIEQLYRRVVDLGDRARGWFDGPGAKWRAGLPAEAQAVVAVETLGTTARLLAMMAWLLDPAQGQEQRPAFVLADDTRDLPAASPLAGVAGGQIAAEAVQLLDAVRALAGGGA